MTAIRHRRDPRLDARSDPVPATSAEQLAQHYGYGQWRKFTIAANARSDAGGWGTIERAAAEHLWAAWERHLGVEQPSEASVAQLMSLNGALYAALQTTLDARGFHAYGEAIDRLEADTVSWESVIGANAAAYWRHAALLWLTLTQGVHAGLSPEQVLGGVGRLTAMLGSTSTPVQRRGRVDLHTIATRSAATLAPMVAMAGKAGRQAGLGLRHAAGVATPVVQDLSRRGYQSARTRWQAWQARQAANRIARDERITRGREEAAAQYAARLEAERARQAQAATSADQNTVTARAREHLTSPRLDGPALRTSVFGTWLMLVVLSWVALIWGAILSMPFGVGLALIASIMGGIVAVPLWGTVFGFLGMGSARSSTLSDMGYQPLDRHHILAGACANYCEALAIPIPQLGTIGAANAFAMGLDHRDATVAIGRPLLDRLSTDEVNAVLAHELGHVVSGDMRRMMLMRTFQNATVWFMMAQGLKQLARWIICWAAELAILAFSRRREYWADAIGAALAGKAAMIGALRKLDGDAPISSGERRHARFMFRAPGLSTHPSMAQRIRALEDETYLRRLPVRREA